MAEKCPCLTDIQSCCACVSMHCDECHKPNRSKFIQGRFCSNCGRPLKAELTRLYVQKSEVEEIFAEIEKQLARYSHIHRYAEEAQTPAEEYADGTPCEMTSVWEVLSLHKNGFDDYETMSKLQENIQDIAKSMLLKEIEVDIACLKKKYTEEKT